MLYSEVFSPDSKTTHFNRAVDRIRTDPRCLELLGDGKKITAFGEETNNKWRRARPIAYDSLSLSLWAAAGQGGTLTRRNQLDGYQGWAGE